MEKEPKFKRLTLDLPPSLHQRLRRLAVEKNTNMKALLLVEIEKMLQLADRSSDERAEYDVKT